MGKGRSFRISWGVLYITLTYNIQRFDSLYFILAILIYTAH